MKDTDNTSKKLIMNIASLLASALVLIAATIAWFASNSTSTVDRVSAMLQNDRVELKYYVGTIPTETLDWDENGEELVIRDADGSVDVPTYFSSVSSWTKTTSALDIDPLYPGEFRVYRVDFRTARSTPLFCLMNVACDENADADKVFQSVYTFTSATGVSSPVEPNMSSLADALTGGSTTARLLDLSASQEGDNVSVYYLVGIPGTDKDGTHDAIRQTGASVSVGTVGLFTGSTAETTTEEE